MFSKPNKTSLTLIQIKPLPLPISLPIQKTAKFQFHKNPPPGDDSKFPFSNVRPYSGNYTGTLAKTINLVEMIPLFLAAVQEKKIDGMRYFDATTRKQVSAGRTSKNENKLKQKQKHKTKRRRLDFDHQISIFWKKGVHIKVFKTGKMLIPACGSEKLAKDAFDFIAKICNTKVNFSTCNNKNLRLIFPQEINIKSFFSWMEQNGFSPTKTRTGRLKIRLWWNNNYYNSCKCKCCPKHCSTIPKNKRGFEQIEGKCIPSTVLFGKKSATIFGTSYDTQRKNVIWTLRQMLEAYNHEL